MTLSKKMTAFAAALFTAAALLVVAPPTPSNATPGGLDGYGGHHCWTNCQSYGKYTGQYHCHRSTARCRRSLRAHRGHGH